MELNPKAPATPRELATQALQGLKDRIDAVFWTAERYGVAHTLALSEWEELTQEVRDSLEEFAGMEYAEEEAEAEE